MTYERLGRVTCNGCGVVVTLVGDRIRPEGWVAVEIRGVAQLGVFDLCRLCWQEREPALRRRERRPDDR